MERVQELRRNAERLRRLASTKTNGGASDDRALMNLADRLDHEAEKREKLLENIR